MDGHLDGHLDGVWTGKKITDGLYDRVVCLRCDRIIKTYYYVLLSMLLLTVLLVGDINVNNSFNVCD